MVAVGGIEPPTCGLSPNRNFYCLGRETIRVLTVYAYDVIMMGCQTCLNS